jgi:CotH kinase protein
LPAQLSTRTAWTGAALALAISVTAGCYGSIDPQRPVADQGGALGAAGLGGGGSAGAGGVSGGPVPVGGTGGGALGGAPGSDAGPPPQGGPPSSPPNAGLDDFFQVAKVHRIELTVAPATWQAFLKEHAAPGEMVGRFEGDVRIDGTALTQVGWKTFGWGSRLENPEKPNLHFDFNDKIAGQNFRGVTRLRLKNNGQDPSGLRQTIVYEAMRKAGLSPPRTTFAELLVNGEPYGFYLVEESFNKEFVRTRTGNDDGAAYEPETCRGFVKPPQGDCTALLIDFKRSFNTMAGAGDDLVQLCAVMNGPADAFLAGVGSKIELAEWVLAIAADTALAGDSDGFSTNGANFRLYHDTASDRLRLYIFGTDTTFDPKYLPGPNPLHPEPEESCRAVNPSYHDIFLEKLLATPAGLALYKDAVRALREGAMSPAAIKARVDALWAALGDKIKSDPRLPKASDPVASKDKIKAFVDARDAELRQAGL